MSKQDDERRDDTPAVMVNLLSFKKDADGGNEGMTGQWLIATTEKPLQKALAGSTPYRMKS